MGPSGEALGPSFAAGSVAGGANEGWGDYMVRMLNERTEKLDIVNDSMQNLSDATNAWAEDVGKAAKKQKRNFVLGALGSKFGL